MLPRKPGDVALRFCDDDDMLSFESKLDDGKGGGIWPRTDKTGKKVRDWDRYIQKAMNHLARTMRGKKDTAEPLELGRLDPRSKERLREPATCFALHFLFMDADFSGETQNKFTDRASYYWQQGTSWLETESMQLDYDTDGSGKVDEVEKNQPFPTRFIRG